jgi:hypothetical protein
MTDIRVQADLAAALRNVSAVVLAVRHKQYLDLDPAWVVEQVGGPLAIVDCFAVLSDDTIQRYLELGCEVKGLGRGHVERLKGPNGGSTPAPRRPA